jgi:hypothetical protein
MKTYHPVAYRPGRMSVDESLRNAAWLRDRMAERRSVRAFSTDPVDERLILDAIAMAGAGSVRSGSPRYCRSAPTSTNRI